MDPITIVAGFGRCGSSLMMQMLAAGGMPTTGAAPAYEAHEAAVVFNGGTLSSYWLRTVPGSAVKVLDPQRGRLGQGIPYRVIWLDRDHDEQAKSHAKFMGIFSGGVTMRREERRAFARSYVRDRPAAFRVLRAAGAEQFLEVHFEVILAAPLHAAAAINRFCGGHLDVQKMAAVVLPRGPECMPDMRLELALLQRATVS